MSSPKQKKSPNSKSSPKSKKGNISQSKINDVVDIRSLFKRIPLPEPIIPTRPLYAQIKRQLSYPHVNNILLEHLESFWAPCCPLITSWSHLWVSDPTLRRIFRYNFNCIKDKCIEHLSPLIMRGEPGMLIEIPKTAKIAIILSYPSKNKTALVLYDPNELKQILEVNIDLSLNKVSSLVSTDLIKENRTIGLCANMDILFVLYQPLQNIKLYNTETLKLYDYSLKYNCIDEGRCIHLATSGGCAANHNFLFVAATRPPKIQMFLIKRQTVLDIIDRIDLIWYAELGLDRLAIGEPFGVQLDFLGMLIVSDTSSGYFRVYKTWDNYPDCSEIQHLKHSETCFLGSWKINPYRNFRPGYFSLGQNGIMCIVERSSNKLLILGNQKCLRWYYDTLLNLSEYKYVRPKIDPLMPIDGLPAPPHHEVNLQRRRTLSDISVDIPAEELLPEYLIKRYLTKTALEKYEETKSPKISKAKVSPTRKSNKLKSPKSPKSPKSSKSPKSNKSKSPTKS